MITNALSALLNNKADNIKIIVQIIATKREILTDLIFGNQSLSVDEDKELIDELKVDIAADNTPAITIPLKPIGKISEIT